MVGFCPRLYPQYRLFNNSNGCRPSTLYSTAVAPAFPASLVTGASRWRLFQLFFYHTQQRRWWRQTCEPTRERATWETAGSAFEAKKLSWFKTRTQLRSVWKLIAQLRSTRYGSDMRLLLWQIRYRIIILAVIGTRVPLIFSLLQDHKEKTTKSECYCSRRRYCGYLRECSTLGN